MINMDISLGNIFRNNSLFNKRALVLILNTQFNNMCRTTDALEILEDPEEKESKCTSAKVQNKFLKPLQVIGMHYSGSLFACKFHGYSCDAKLRVELCCGSPLTWDVPPREKISRDASHTGPVQNNAAVCCVQSSEAIHFWKIHWNKRDSHHYGINIK